MKIFSYTALIFLLAVPLIAIGCGAFGDTSTDGGGSSDGDHDTAVDGDLDDDGQTQTGLTLADIQNVDSPGHPPEGRVEVKDIIVTSDPFQVSSSGLMGIFVADRDGGPWSGCLITWEPTSSEPVFGYDPPDMIPGMIIDVEGVYTEYCGYGDNINTHCSTQIELTPFQQDNGTVTDTGQTDEIPNPATVNPADVKTDGPLSEQWQDSLIRVENVLVTDSSLGYGMFEVSGGLEVDDVLHHYDLPNTGDGFLSLTGFLYTSYDTFKLLPRDGDDMAPGEVDGDFDGDIENPPDLTIADIQNPASPNHPDEGRVSLSGIVVTSDAFVISTSSGLKGIFVSDTGGGPWSGCILTWTPTSEEPEYGYDPPTMTPGMIIDVEGKFTEYCGYGDPLYEHCSTQIELTPFQAENGTVTDTGSTAQAPSPVVVDPADVKTGGTLSEQWQDSLIRVANVTVTDSALGYGMFEVSGDLEVDDTLFHYDLPDTGDAFLSLTGFLYTSYNTYKLLPRNEGDMLTGEIDGDFDDDMENLPDLTIADIQDPGSPNHPAEGPVSLSNIVVTSEAFVISASSGLTGIFVSDTGGGPWSGCLLTWTPTSEDPEYGYDPPSMTPGMIIDVEGKFTEYCGYGDPLYEHCSTQIELTPFQADNGTVTDTGGTAQTPSPVLVDPADVNTGATLSEQWQDSLIRVENVTVTDAALGYGMFEVSGDLEVDDTLFHYDLPNSGDGFLSLTGFLYTSYDTYKLLPRNEADMVTGDIDGDVDDEEDAIEFDVEDEVEIPQDIIMINEVYYDPDVSENEFAFIELYGPADLPLDGYSLVAINGNGGSEYGTISLDGQVIDSDKYFLIAHTYANSALVAIADMLNDEANLQNGPDSLKLVYASHIIDAVAYGTAEDLAYMVYETAPGPDVPTNSGQSIARIPDHSDTNDNSVDFIICPTPTPGVSNEGCSIQTDGDIDLEPELESPSEDETETEAELEIDQPSETEPESEGENTDNEIPAGHVMINELFYDPDGADELAAFIELYGPADFSLDGYTLVGTNGSTGLEYANIALDGKTIPGDSYFLIVHTQAEAGLAAIADMLSSGADLQNGFDSVELKSGDTVVDALGYGLEVDPNYTIWEGSPAPDVATNSGHSLARAPDHSDTNDNSVDFVDCITPTPGVSNVCTE